MAFVFEEGESEGRMLSNIQKEEESEWLEDEHQYEGGQRERIISLCEEEENEESNNSEELEDKGENDPPVNIQNIPPVPEFEFFEHEPTAQLAIASTLLHWLYS